jgi:hypothetical protein
MQRRLQEQGVSEPRGFGFGRVQEGRESGGLRQWSTTRTSSFQTATTCSPEVGTGCGIAKNERTGELPPAYASPKLPCIPCPERPQALPPSRIPRMSQMM